MQEAHEPGRRRPARVRRVIAGAVVTLFGLGPTAGGAYAQRDAPPHSTPAAGRHSERSIEEIQRRARAYPIPTRGASGPAPTTVPRGDDREHRVAGTSAAVLTAVGGLIAVVALRRRARYR